MEANNSGRVGFSLAWWCLLAAAVVVALISCHGARAASEAGNATIPQLCHGGECLIAYRQPEVELMAVLDPEHALGSMLASIKPGDATKGSGNKNDPANCGREGEGRTTPCVPEKNSGPKYDVYKRTS